MSLKLLNAVNITQILLLNELKTEQDRETIDTENLKIYKYIPINLQNRTLLCSNLVR